MPTARKYGWRPSFHDPRDLKYSLKMPRMVDLPKKVDLRPEMPTIWDQLDLGACTAHALGAMYWHVTKKLGQTVFMPSRLFVYFNERVVEKTVNEDAGSTLRTGIKTLARQGVCPEEMWPYDVAKFKRKPLKKCYEAGVGEKITEYRRLDNRSLVELKTCLAEGNPFVFGFVVFKSFEDGDVSTTGVMTMPDADDQPLGGHAVCCVGYDDERQVFIVRNSWGEEWGDKGHVYVPYSFVTDTQYCDDFWTVTRVL
jgi:C1A family cysteine protease